MNDSLVHIQLIRLDVYNFLEMCQYDHDILDNFDYDSTNFTFVAVIHVDKSIDFHYHARLARDMLLAGSVHNHRLVNWLSMRLNRIATRQCNGYSFQFYKVLIIFDDVFNKEYGCCFSLFAPTIYDLQCDSKPFEAFMKDSIPVKSHKVSVVFADADMVHEMCSLYDNVDVIPFVLPRV